MPERGQTVMEAEPGDGTIPTGAIFATYAGGVNGALLTRSRADKYPCWSAVTSQKQHIDRWMMMTFEA